MIDIRKSVAPPLVNGGMANLAAVDLRPIFIRYDAREEGLELGIERGPRDTLILDRLTAERVAVQKRELSERYKWARARYYPMFTRAQVEKVLGGLHFPSQALDLLNQSEGALVSAERYGLTGERRAFCHPLFLGLRRRPGAQSDLVVFVWSGEKAGVVDRVRIVPGESRRFEWNGGAKTFTLGFRWWAEATRSSHPPATAEGLRAVCSDIETLGFDPGLAYAAFGAELGLHRKSF